MYNTLINNGYLRDNIYVAMPDDSENMPLLRLVSGELISLMNWDFLASSRFLSITLLYHLIRLTSLVIRFS